MRSLLRALSSLRLTVVLLALSMFLIFAGTWAQIDMGIWATLKTYFRTLYVFIPFQIFFPRQWEVPGGIPFPGGYVLGGLLLANLLAAHALRFAWSWRRLGIILVHFGIVLLIVGEWVTALYANEANMTIAEGQTVNYTEDSREIELAVIDGSDPEHDRVVAIPASHLRTGATIEHAELPFSLRVDRFLPNADLFRRDEAPDSALELADRGLAQELDLVALERPVVSGVDQNVMDLPSAFVTLIDAGAELGTYLTSLYFHVVPQEREQTVVAGGKPYRLVMRYKRTYKPYSLQLLDFRHDRYLGTETPRNFSSQVRLIDQSRNEDREVLIYMNNPLRYRGETFYQASFKRGDTTTILQVVRNPGWLLPYIACTIGAIGMLIHFGMHLTKFLRRRVAA